jgi:hypothetical protein
MGVNFCFLCVLRTRIIERNLFDLLGVNGGVFAITNHPKKNFSFVLD